MKRVEIIDGREFEVTVLPQDERLQPSKVKRRQLFQSLSAPQKQAVIRESISRSKKRRRRRRRK